MNGGRGDGGADQSSYKACVAHDKMSWPTCKVTQMHELRGTLANTLSSPSWFSQSRNDL